MSDFYNKNTALLRLDLSKDTMTHKYQEATQMVLAELRGRPEDALGIYMASPDQLRLAMDLATIAGAFVTALANSVNTRAEDLVEAFDQMLDL